MPLILFDNNFYDILDPSSLIATVSVDGAAVDHNITIYLEPGATSLEIALSNTSTFTHQIATDPNGEQRVYEVLAGLSGLTHGAPGRLTLLDWGGSDQPGALSVEHDISMAYEDEDFWLTRTQMTVSLVDATLVDNLYLQADAEIISSGMALASVQVDNALIVTIEATPALHVTAERHARFGIQIGDAIAVSQSFTISPRDPADARCSLGGALFATQNITLPSDSTSTIVFSLQSETWVEDMETLRAALLGSIAIVPEYSATGSWFADERAPAANVSGLATTLSAASLRRDTEQQVTLDVSSAVSVLHPELISVADTLPATSIRSGKVDVPIHTPFTQRVYPGVGRLHVETSSSNGQHLTDETFWNGATLTLAVEHDQWQPFDDLTSNGQAAFLAHLRGSLSLAGAWNDMIGSADISVSTSVRSTGGVTTGLLNMHFAPLSVSAFNLTSTIAVPVNIPLSTASGLVTRMSGAPLPNSSYFVVTSTQAYVTSDTLSVSERTLWSADADITLALHSDHYVGSAADLQTAFRAQFTDALGSNNVSDALTITLHSLSVATLTLPQSTYETFGISADVVLHLSIAGEYLRNGQTLTIPPLTLLTSPVVATLALQSAVDTTQLSAGFTMAVTLVDDEWLHTDNTFSTASPVHFTSRQDAPSGWNHVVSNTLTYSVGGQTLHVTVPANSSYAASTNEVVDVVIDATSTRSPFGVFVDTFTVFNASTTELDHVSYMHVLNTCLANALALKHSTLALRKGVQLLKHLKNEAPTWNFQTGEGVHERIRKLNDTTVDYPLALCAPPLLFGTTSATALSFASSVNSTLSTATAGGRTALPLTRTCRPVIVPEYSTTSSKHVYNIILSRPLACTITINGGTPSARSAAAVHLVYAKKGDDTIQISGTGILTTSWS